MLRVKNWKMSSQTRNSGIRDRKFKVSYSRYPETKLKEQTCEKRIFFEMEKCIAIQVTRFAEFHDFGNRRETTLDLKHQKLETKQG